MLFQKHIILLAKRDTVTSNPSVCDMRALHPTQGFNFSGIFLHHIVAWPSGNSPTKNHEDHPRGSPIRANRPNRHEAVTPLIR